MPHPQYYNLYGPTETNVITYHHVQPADIAPEVTQPLPIGIACANSDVFALKEDGSHAAVGEEGELVARGPTLMRGYWGQPERTAQSLVAQTVIAGLSAEKLYRTGDHVEAGEGNLFHFHGRLLDNMIKSRGYRIELGDIEATLYSHPEVAEAVVLAVPDEEISHRLIAVILAKADAELTARHIKSHVGTQVPKYMVPDEVRFVAQLPYTSTGKVDRRTLLNDYENGKAPDV